MEPRQEIDEEFLAIVLDELRIPKVNGAQEPLVG
jgi:hypothetical protein